MSKKVGFLLANKEYTLDGTRSALGLAVENMYAYAYVLNNELTEVSDYHKENIEWIRDMEGEVYTTVDANVENLGMPKITIEEIGKQLRDLDYIIPYGIMRSDKS
ncbi:MAG: hypothetical protein A2505_09150 [Deltaproteobacteria bacterium RIFOXYD12_FULL_55_16]|nr:MAG: hypothetical protein A2505_09150 [Deltaproteobacteria bacterium RIFOXYD12_FULL_55_16]